LYQSFEQAWNSNIFWKWGSHQEVGGQQSGPSDLRVCTIDSFSSSYDCCSQEVYKAHTETVLSLFYDDELNILMSGAADHTIRKIPFCFFANYLRVIVHWQGCGVIVHFLAQSFSKPASSSNMRLLESWTLHLLKLWESVYWKK
jgi:hypothetical protein